MLSIKWIVGVDYYLKKRRSRRTRKLPDDDDGSDPADESDDAHGLDYYFDGGEPAPTCLVLKVWSSRTTSKPSAKALVPTEQLSFKTPERLIISRLGI
jgi:hypothetical protein